MLYDRCLGFLLIFLFGLGFVFASSYSVCAENCDFASISQAISNSNDGDIINVLTGDYNEKIVINKNLILFAEKGVNIYGNSPVVLITDKNVTIKGFNIFPTDDLRIGIKINNSNDYSIDGNFVEGNIVYGMGVVPKTSFLTGMAVADDFDSVDWLWIFLIIVFFLVSFVIVRIVKKKKHLLNKVIKEDIGI